MEMEEALEQDEEVLGYVVADLTPCLEEAMIVPGTVLQARVRTRGCGGSEWVHCARTHHSHDFQGAETSTPLLIHAGGLYTGKVDDLCGSMLVVDDDGDVLCKVEKQITFWPWRDGSTVPTTSAAAAGKGGKPSAAGTAAPEPSPPPADAAVSGDVGDGGNSRS